MIINTDKKFISIHQPKTGGTTLKFYFLNNVPGSSNYKDGTRDMHFSIAGVNPYIGDDNLDEYYKFMFVRNPWDWYVSLYEYTKKKNVHEWRFFNDENNNTSFKNWLNNIINVNLNPNIVKQFNNQKISDSTFTLYQYGNKTKLKNQYGWHTLRYIYSSYLNWKQIFESDAFILTDVNDINDVFRLEDNYVDFIDVFSSKICDISSLLAFGRKNVNRKEKTYKHYYDDDSFEWVNTKESFIINKYNYSF